MKRILIGLFLALVCGCYDEKETKAADNTARNTRDRGETTTPVDQSESQADLALTQDVRQVLMDDESLGWNAKNVKVITANGKVTLRGPVDTEDEKRMIEEKVRAVSGVTSVDSQLEVKK